MTTDTDEAKIADLLEQWEESYEAGQEISAEELAHDCPEIIPKLKQRIKALKATAWLNQPLENEDQRQTPNDFGLPQNLGRYQLQSLLGAGGFGQVWKAFDPELLRPVAIKIPHPDRIKTTDDVQSFFEEAQKVAQLRHPGIVPVHDVGQQDGIVFIVSEFMEGGNLADWMAGNKVPVEKTCEMIGQIAEALHSAHTRGFVHRDIKAANILIDGEGHPVLSDFGIAISTHEDDPTRLGSLAYMPPEQLSGEKTDARSDIYSLGVVLFQMLTGDLPRQASSQKKLKASFEQNPNVSLPTSVPARLQQICQRCLAVDPKHRYSTAQELAGELGKLKDSTWGFLGWSISSVLIVGTLVLSFLSKDWWAANSPPQKPSADSQNRSDRLAPLATNPIRTQTEKDPTKNSTLLVKHSSAVRTIAVFPNQLLIASVGNDGKVQLNGIDGKNIASIDHEGMVTALTTLGHDTLITGAEDGVIRFWDISKSKPEQTKKLTAWTSSVTGIAVNPNGDYLVASSTDRKIILYLLKLNPPRATPIHETVGTVLNLDFTGENSFVIGMGTNDKKPALFRAYRIDAKTKALHPTSNTPMQQTHHTTTMAVSEDGEYILTACNGLGIIVWRLKGQSLLAEGVFASHTSPMTAVAVVPGNLQAVSADQDATVRVWNLADQSEVGRVIFNSPVTCLRASGTQVVIGLENGEVRTWKLPQITI